MACFVLEFQAASPILIKPDLLTKPTIVTFGYFGPCAALVLHEQGHGRASRRGRSLVSLMLQLNNNDSPYIDNGRFVV
jgi:hypothetical protein